MPSKAAMKIVKALNKKASLDPDELFDKAIAAIIDEELEGLIYAVTEALNGMEGGTENSPCHQGICSRAACSQCRRVDNLQAVLKYFTPPDPSEVLNEKNPKGDSRLLKSLDVDPDGLSPADWPDLRGGS